MAPADQDKRDDTRLLLAYAGGDLSAARLLTTRLAPRCLAFCTRMLAGDRAEAEDVTQEAMLRLWKQAPKWQADGAAQPGTWLLKVASNLCIDRLRKTRGTSLDEIAEPPDPTPGMEAQLHTAARLSALDAALATLPDRQRQALVMRHIEGFSNPEIAETLDITVEAAESLTARGKRALTAALAPQKEELSHG